LRPTAADDYLLPYVVKEFDGQRVGFIGIDIAQKTRVSSRPLATTEFLDEVETTQRYVDELADMGIDNIVLVSHYTYENDLALAAQVTGVDAIVGGDSHTLLGDFSAIGLTSGGPYPTQVTNADGDPVCVVQAWQYAWVVGQLGVTFDDGRAVACNGTPHLLLGDTFTGDGATDEGLAAVQSVIEATPSLSIVTPDPVAQAVLDQFAAEVSVLEQTVVGQSADALCSRRVPDRPRNTTLCDGDVTAGSGAQLSVNGGFIQQVVADAFLASAPRADLSLQNAGGVRTEIAPGGVTIAKVYEVLPFSNTLVELEMTGAEIARVLEEAVANFLDNDGSDGSYPYGSAIRWEVDVDAAPGSRFSDIEVRDETTGDWNPIDPERIYVVVTNDFLAGGRDGWTTFGEVSDRGDVTNTFVNYAQGLYDYLVALDETDGAITVPPPTDFSTQEFRGSSN
jgi:5'-nucleotidase / UDP-sugar diphosphatase